MPKGRPRRKCFVPKVKQHLESRAYYVPELSKDPHARCCFCLTDVQDPLHFGPFFRTETFSVHYLCMLTAGNIVQRDPDGEAGLAGFMPEDILRERARAYMLHCRICGKRGATMGCRGNSKERCRMTYHYACAIANDFGVCFFEDEKQSFSSYCPTHKVLQEKLLSKDISSVCTLCYEDVFPSATSSIEYPCCRNGYAHVECLRRYAFNSGLDHFECPLCKNKALFRDTCQRYGSIFLPEHNVPVWFADADDELLDRGPSECIAIKCSAPEGRKVDKLSGKWCLLPCFTCGHVAMHAACCGNQLLVGSKKKYYQCELCKELIGKEQEERRKSLDPFRKYPFIQNIMPWHPSDFEGTGAVETFEFIETGRGVRAMKEITPGSTVFSIPKSVIITPTSVLRSSFGEQLLKVLSIKINPTELLTLYVVCHLLHWPCIKWLSNYFKSLPDFTKSTSLLYWTENELSLLPTALKDEALKRKASLKALYSNTNHLFNGAAGLLDYINANDCVESRSVYFDCSLKGLPQLIDNSTVSANVALVPFLDMLNHSSSPSVQPSFDSLTSPSSLQIAAINKLTKNEQLFISYGQHSNEILLQFYGFVLENNPCDVIFIEVDDLAECCAFASSLHDGWIQSNVFVSAQLPSWWLITLLCSKSFDEWFGFREGQVDLPSILEAESHKIIVDLLIKKRRRLVSGLDFDVSISKQKSQLVKSFFATKINVIDNFINFNL